MSKVNLSRVKPGDLELKDKVVSINRVVKTTKGGRAFSFSALVVVGNGNGVVGHGLGKAKEVQEAITKGIEDAKKNLIKVPVMHGVAWCVDVALAVRQHFDDRRDPFRCGNVG